MTNLADAGFRKAQQVVHEEGARTDTSSIVLPLRAFGEWLLWGALIVWGLGAARVVWLEIAGSDTVVGNLQKLNLDDDLAMGSWYSSMLLAVSAVLLLIIALAKKSQPGGSARHWAFLGAVFVMLSLDEAIGLHELSLKPLSFFGEISPLLTFGWIALAIPALLVLAFVYLPFVRRLPRSTMLGFVLAGITYVVGVIALGMLGGAIFAGEGDQKTFALALISTAEEGLELLGISVFVMVLIRYVANHLPKIMLS
jgi:hypothetical protein